MSTVRSTPTTLKILRGNPGKRRVNRAEPQFKIEPLPEPPGFLDKLAKQEWRRVALELHQLGLLTVADRNAFAAYCQAYARWVRAEEALLVNGAMQLTLHSEKTKGAIYNPTLGIA